MFVDPVSKVNYVIRQGFIQVPSGGGGSSLGRPKFENPPRSFGQVYSSFKNLVIAVIKRAAVTQVQA